MRHIKSTDIRAGFLLVLAIATVSFASFKIGRQKTDFENLQQLTELVRLSNQYSGMPSDSSLRKFLVNANIKFPHIVYAQAIHESNHFTSNLCVTNHNLFGMRYPGSRVTTAIGEVNGYAYYENWIDSVIDYALWFQTYAHKCQTDNDVYALLGHRYAKDPDYARMIKEIASSY